MAGERRVAHTVRDAAEKLWRKMRFRAVRLLLYAVVAAAFLAVVSSLVEEYRLRRKVFIVDKMTEPPSPFPPVTLCPWPPFNPLRLVRLGLNASAASAEELLARVENLSGLEDDSVTGRTLVEEAAWRVEDVVEEVKVGGRREVYSEKGASTRLWQRSFLPVGPCLTMSPPALASRTSLSMTIRVRPRPLNLDLCSRREADSTRSLESLCLPIEQNDNKSLWGDYLATEFFLTFFAFLSSTDVCLQMHIANTDLKVKIPLNISVTHYQVTYSDDYGDAPTCFHQCVTKASEVEKCNAIFDRTIDNPIRDLCVTQEQLYKVALEFLIKSDLYYTCLRTCKPQKNEHRWVLKPRISAEPSAHQISVYLTSSITTNFKEVMLYPRNDLVADVGGTMGLFLGTSLLDMWTALHAGLKYLVCSLESPRFCVGSRISQASAQLSLLLGQIALSITACTHLGLATMNYIFQAKEVTVSLRSSVGLSAGDIARGSHSVHDLVMSHLASRPLGCRLSSRPSEQECLIRCVLDGTPLIPLPLSVVEDLNECSEEHLAPPRRKYIIPSYIAERIKNSEEVGPCMSKCGAPNNTLGGFGKVHFAVEEEPRFSPSKLICTFGGIIGFYFGVSLLRLFQEISIRMKSFSISIKPILRKVTSLAAISLAVLSCLLLMTSQLSSFIVSHPIDSSYVYGLLKKHDLPAVTACVWPPFSPQKLLKSAGLAEEYDLTVGLDHEKRHIALVPLLQILAKAPQPVDARLLWASSAWNRSEVYFDVTLGGSYAKIPECRDCPLKDSAIFIHCKTFNPNFVVSESLRHLEYHVKVYTNKSISAYVSINSQDDDSVMEPDFVTDKGYVSVEASLLQRWSGLRGDDVGRGKCLTRCLEDALEDKMECVLPWFRGRKTSPVCDTEQVARFLAALWSLGPHPERIFPALLGRAKTTSCRKECHARKGMFYAFSVLGDQFKLSSQSLTTGIAKRDKDVMVLSATFLITTDTCEQWSVYDRYPLARLLGDLGGVAGMTLGASVASLLAALRECLLP